MTRPLLLTLALIAAGTSQLAPAADFSGVRMFWHVVDQLQRDKDPSAAEWDSLFATPGYAALQTRERRRAALTAGFRAAFMPSRRAERDSLVTLKGWTARVIRHVESLPSRRADLDAFMHQLERDDIVQRAVDRVQTLLPSETAARFGNPSVAFVFFLPDGRGYPALIVADLAEVMSKRDPVPFFAHEASHFYFAQLANEVRLTEGDVRLDGPAALLDLLTKLEEESIGDQFDKIDAIVLDSAKLADKYRANADWVSYLVAYRQEFDSAAVRLHHIDVVLQRIGATPGATKQLSDSVAASLPLEGRPVGMYITRSIRRVLGDSILASTVGDPLRWMRAYERAAQQIECRCVALSPASVLMIEGAMQRAKSARP